MFRFLLVPGAVALQLSACVPEPGTPERVDVPDMQAVPRDTLRNVDSLIGTMLEVEPLVLDLETALGLVALPLACIDRPHRPPRAGAGYLDDRSSTRRPDYENTRAFYGCYDWHSAVNSTWAMARLLREFPDMPVGRLVREKLNDHLTAATIAGELEFYGQNQNFERPYGWAWLFELYRELRSWDDVDARRWTATLEPLVDTLVSRVPPYLESLSYPIRVGTHANTAFALTMMLAYARESEAVALAALVVDRARAFFIDDVGCPVDYEPSGADFLSPCLEEARLMSRILPGGDFVPWLDEFLPSVDADEFASFRQPIVHGDSAIASDDTGVQGAKSHLIGLALSRAEALNQIAAALPTDDLRFAAYRSLAAFQARHGYDAMFDAEYLGTHWIGTFALRYLLSVP